MRKALRNNTLTRPFYNLARELYRSYHRTKSSALYAYVKLATGSDPSRTFKWNGLTLKEGAKHHWKAAAMADDLREYRRISDAVAGLLADRNDPVLFDIGANLGIFTYLFAGVKGARVFSFEPVTYTFQYLNENIKANKLDNVRCYNMGISNSPREMFISTTANSPGMGHFSVNVSQDDPYARSVGQIAQFNSINSFCGAQGVERIDFMKIDVEGHEASVFDGAGQTLKSSRPIVQIEIARENPDHVHRMFELFRNLDYTACGWDGRSLTPIQIKDWISDNRFDIDVFFIPNGASTPSATPEKNTSKL